MAAGSTFGERFRFARDFQRLSGRPLSDGDLAKMLGFKSQSEVTTYKTRPTPPHAERILIVALECGVDPGWLAFGDDSKAPAPDGFSRWLDNQPKQTELPIPGEQSETGLQPSPLARNRRRAPGLEDSEDERKRRA